MKYSISWRLGALTGVVPVDAADFFAAVACAAEALPKGAVVVGIRETVARKGAK